MESIRKRSGTSAMATTSSNSNSNKSRITVPDGGDFQSLSSTIGTSSPRRRKVGQSKGLSLPSSTVSLRKWIRGNQKLGLVAVAGVIGIYLIASHLFLSSHMAHTSFRFGSWSEWYKSDRVLFQRIGVLTTTTTGLSLSYKAPSPQDYLPIRPRVVGFYFETPKSDSYLGTERMDPNMIRLHKTHTVVKVSPDALAAQEDLLDSEDYQSGKTDPFETKDCVAQYDWQLKTFPTCNALMERDLTDLTAINPITHKEQVRIIANGYWRDVWRVQQNNGNPSIKNNRRRLEQGQDQQDQEDQEEQDPSNELVVLKTIRYEHDYEERNYDRHRRDAVAMERLTSSHWVMDIYGFCGNSGLFEFADGGALDDSIFYGSEDEEDWTPKEKLIVAYQVAAGMASTHNFAKEGVPAIAHTDITSSQFVYVVDTGIYKLNDFNRCRFIRWNKAKNTTCPYRVGNNPGTNRSPEEYAYHPQTEKVDVYSMGNIFYEILTGKWAWEDLPKANKKARELVKKGQRPPVPSNILNSTNFFEQVLLNVTKASWVQDPNKRISSRQAERYIAAKLSSKGVHQVSQ